MHMVITMVNNLVDIVKIKIDEDFNKGIKDNWVVRKFAKFLVFIIF